MRRLILALALSLAVLLLWLAAPALRHHVLMWTLRAPEPAMLAQPPRYRTLLFVGQSNSANHGATRAEAGLPHLAWFDGQAFRLRDPLPGCSGIGGSVGARLASRHGEAAPPWLIACVAQGSTAISQWRPGTPLFARARAAMMALAAQGEAVDWVVIHQGESDAAAGTDPVRYGSDLRALIAGLQALSPGTRFLLGQTTRWRDGGDADPGLRAAQQQVWQDDPRVWAGVDTDSFPARLRARGDGVHFSDAGLDVFADLLARALREPADRAVRWME